MPYLEKDLTADFSKFLRKNPEAKHIAFPFAVEFKVKKHNHSLNLKNDFEPQQIPSLLKVMTSCLYTKMSDMSRGAKPFDAFQMCYSPAFIGVLWYKPRATKIVYLLDVRDINDMINRKVKSINEEEAKKIAIYTIYLKTK